jgi:hypothetical protein
MCTLLGGSHDGLADIEAILRDGQQRSQGSVPSTDRRFISYLGTFVPMSLGAQHTFTHSTIRTDVPGLTAYIYSQYHSCRCPWAHSIHLLTVPFVPMSLCSQHTFTQYHSYRCPWAHSVHLLTVPFVPMSLCSQNTFIPSTILTSNPGLTAYMYS